MARVLYTLLLRGLLPFALLRLWWRGRREPGYRESVAERLGHYAIETRPKLVWVHAVSVGEARAAAPLVRAIAAELEGHEVLVTCTTAAGRETLKQVYGESVLAAYLPYDLPEMAQHFLEHFRPRLGVLMETEVWPNLLAGCARFGVPVLLANARLSERSARGYRRWRSLARPAFEALAAVCAQSEEDAERLVSLGAPRVAVTGNLKFDVQPDAAQLARGRSWRAALGRPVLLLASTREGEEALLLEEMKKAFPGRDASQDPLILIVPRHPQRFDEVARWAQARRSTGQAPEKSTRVYLGDTMGEMAFYYAACDVAVVGGSFLPLGGQNLIEACAAGAPTIVGPHMYNFTEATRLAMAAGAVLQAVDAAVAAQMAMRLLADAEARARMAAAGRKLCETHRGATARHLATCRALLAAWR